MAELGRSLEGAKNAYSKGDVEASKQAHNQREPHQGFVYFALERFPFAPLFLFNDQNFILANTLF